ncbi:hypothetical protein ZHAS_00005199 [Anopheles sinensis]|uniref:Uncharacterized protein n=1 Tax=Anopheles sinensis TaxID=74873 RepID=A0A084VIT7_ANOSI|nr:hypothetical protein ZHAS_00005199 [Anopheles sinensis]
MFIVPTLACSFASFFSPFESVRFTSPSSPGTCSNRSNIRRQFAPLPSHASKVSQGGQTPGWVAAHSCGKPGHAPPPVKAPLFPLRCLPTCLHVPIITSGSGAELPNSDQVYVCIPTVSRLTVIVDVYVDVRPPNCSPCQWWRDTLLPSLPPKKRPEVKDRARSSRTRTRKDIPLEGEPNEGLSAKTRQNRIRILREVSNGEFEGEWGWVGERKAHGGIAN